jgi:hypothetical protein
MARQRKLYPALAVWEIIRLLVLIGLVAYAALGVLFPTGEIIVLCLLLGAGNLIVPFGAFYLHFTGVASRPLRLALVAAKVLGLFTCVLGFLSIFLRFIGSAAAGDLASGAFLNLLISLKEEAETASTPPPA